MWHARRMADDPPKVFIGSSSEGQAYTDALQALLEKRRSNVEWVMWSGDAFSLGRTNIENLVQNADKCDYAILVVAPDNVTVSRGTERPSPRDNVVFEIGLFIGRLGRDRTAIVAEERAQEALPTDLLWVMAADFRTHLGGKPRTSMEAIGPTISRVSRLLAKARRKSHDGTSWSPSPWTGVGVAHRHLEIFRCTRDGLGHRWFDEQEGLGAEAQRTRPHPVEHRHGGSCISGSPNALDLPPTQTNRSKRSTKRYNQPRDSEGCSTHVVAQVLQL